MNATHPLTAAQLGIWQGQQASPDVPYIAAQYIEVHGDLDVELLQAATDQGSRELESATVVLEGTPTQPQWRVVPDIDDALVHIDLRDETDPVAAAQKWMANDFSQPRDLFADRLIAAVVLTVGDDHHYWYSRVHHVVMDGAGAAALIRRIVQIYNHLRAGNTPPPSGALPLTELYAAQDRYRSSTRFEADAAYWRARAHELPEPARLTTRTAPPSAVPVIARAYATAEVTSSVEALAASSGGTVASVLIAAFGLYLSRCTSFDDVVLSVPVSGRTTARDRASGGMVSNVLPLHIRISDGENAVEYSQRVRAELSGVLRHQKYPFHEITSTRSGFGPVVNVMTFETALELGQTTTDFHVLSSGMVDDIVLNLYPPLPGGGIRIDLEANPALYTEYQVRGHLDRFLHVLAEFAELNDGALRELSVLTAAERSALVPRSAEQVSQTATLPELLRGVPDDTAVICGDIHLTYRQLRERIDL
ncbi:MAG: non-ribosomal peptide synthetase, partial [Rhodococcus sp.]|nr:non-ribosomal peptide synthetase [Rhodococcus sp. (in: high G+C Gram-positive bacteria)]